MSTISYYLPWSFSTYYPTTTWFQPYSSLSYYKPSKQPIPFLSHSSFNQLIIHDSPINDSVIYTSLQQLTNAQPGIRFLDTFFYTTLVKEGWQAVFGRYLSTNASHRSYRSSPKIPLDSPTILILIHVNGNHWVAVARRIINNQVFFFYADDLNQNSTEREIKHNLSAQKTSMEFYPSHSKWIKCTSYTYQPHYNECGLRTLLALTAMGLYPSPHSSMLLPFMHNALAQFLRWWVGSMILNFTSINFRPFLIPHAITMPYTAMTTYPSAIIDIKSHLFISFQPCPQTDTDPTARPALCDIGNQSPNIAPLIPLLPTITKSSKMCPRRTYDNTLHKTHYRPKESNWNQHYDTPNSFQKPV